MSTLKIGKDNTINQSGMTISPEVARQLQKVCNNFTEELKEDIAYIKGLFKNSNGFNALSIEQLIKLKDHITKAKEKIANFFMDEQRNIFTETSIGNASAAVELFYNLTIQKVLHLDSEDLRLPGALSQKRYSEKKQNLLNNFQKLTQKYNLEEVVVFFDTLLENLDKLIILNKVYVIEKQDNGKFMKKKTMHIDYLQQTLIERFRERDQEGKYAEARVLAVLEEKAEGFPNLNEKEKACLTNIYNEIKAKYNEILEALQEDHKNLPSWLGKNLNISEKGFYAMRVWTHLYILRELSSTAISHTKKNVLEKLIAYRGKQASIQRFNDTLDYYKNKEDSNIKVEGSTLVINKKQYNSTKSIREEISSVQESICEQLQLFMYFKHFFINKVYEKDIKKSGKQ